ncbi:uncharacterized protein LOC132306711 isoform X2 [Cornus florida]|uniref:uncharacterized protein LOC132306711 isoform X2 n=1 Tax=Cornus florida TaxID=4283 RepID=UPI00289A4E7E|nr:uncharacterized protein LOC132306711 isoform X2 [Cornus florida]
MKRRSKINPRDPPKTRSSSLRDFRGGRSSDNRFDMGKAKRVKFTDPETNHPPGCRTGASPIHYEAAQAPSSDAPKTSEYAFFKKLKKDAGCDHSYQLRKEDTQLNHFESSEITNMSKSSCGDLRSSLLFEKVGPVNNYLFLSPLAGASKNSEVTNVVKDRLKDIRSPLLVRKVSSVNHDLLFSPLGGASKNSETQYSVEEIFSKRRERLLQWVAETSLPEVDKLSAKGCDLVSVLLSRLFPNGNENNYFRDSKPRQTETGTKNKLLAFPESDDKELTWNHERGFMMPKHGPHCNDFSAECWSNGSRDGIFSRWNTVGSDSPETQVQYKNRKSGCDYDGGRTGNLINQNDPYVHFCFQNHRSLVSSHLKELDKFQDVNESALGREPRALLLGWDSENVKDGQGLSLAYPESDTYVKELNWTHRRDFMESILGPDSSEFSSECWSNGSGEIILSGSNTLVSDSPSTSYATRTHLLYGNKKPASGFDSGRSASLLTDSDSYVQSRFENHGSMASNHLNQLDEFQDPNESACGRETHALLLGWDSDNMRDGGDLSVTAHNAEMNLHSTLATSWGDDQESVDNGFDATELYPTSFFSNYPHKFTSLPHFRLADFHAHDFRRLLEDEKYLVAKLNPFPQTLSPIPKCLNLVEGCNNDNTCEAGSMFLSPQNYQWFIGKVLSEKHLSGMEALLSSGLDLDLEWKCFPETDSFREHYLSTCHTFQSPQKEGKCSYLLTEEEQEIRPYSTIAHFAKDTLKSHNWPSINFQISLSKEMASSPLQLGNSSWLRSEEELYDDHDESKYI